MQSRLSAQLKQLREEKGWTLRDMAERAGVTHGTVANIETGRYEPKVSTFAAIARALGLGPKKILEILDSSLDKTG